MGRIVRNTIHPRIIIVANNGSVCSVDLEVSMHKSCSDSRRWTKNIRNTTMGIIEVMVDNSCSGMFNTTNDNMVVSY